MAADDSTAGEVAPCCFVIAPIGEEGSDVRERSDQILRHIIKPVASDVGYRAIRADQIAEPGLISSQVIQHVVDDPIVIADLTGHNPNVFYELGLRHAVRKPVIQLAQAEEPLPFDIATVRTIFLDHRNMDSVERCRENLKQQMLAIKNGAGEADSPVAAAINLQELRRSGKPLEKSNAEILEGLAELRRLVNLLVSRMGPREAKRAAKQAQFDEMLKLALEVTDLGDLRGDAESRLAAALRAADSGMLGDAGPRLAAALRDVAEPSIPSASTPPAPWVPSEDREDEPS